MKIMHLLALVPLLFSTASAQEQALPTEIQQIMNQAKYKHSFWGMYVKDLQTGKVLYDLNSDKLFSPASTSKIFSVEALLDTFGDDFRFKTPVYATGEMQNGELHGNLVLVAQGDLTMGGRQSDPNKISYTKLDHIIANNVPGVILTKEDPLHGITDLAKQVYQSGLRTLTGDVVIDDSLFDSTEARGMMLSPMMINENLLDIIVNPSTAGEPATITWRPNVPGYSVENQVKTVAKDGPLELNITSDGTGHAITLSGTIPIDQQDVVRTFAIKDPTKFARAAFIQALQQQGIKISLHPQKTHSYTGLKPIALWTSPPLTEYAKLILKVSHNLGADLIPLLLASRTDKKTFDNGMRLMGDFVAQKVKISPSMFVFADAAGGNENRLTPQAEVQLLAYIHTQPPERFQHFFDALPILGVDGSLEDFAKKTSAAGRVRAKPGTGISANLATGTYFLTTQALAGYIEGKNGHTYAYMLVVNNSDMPTINDIFPIFEDESQISSIIYNNTQ